MQPIDALLDGVKARRAIPSDYKLAAFLGVVPGAVKHWRHGRSLPDARVAARIASELEIDPDVLVAELEAQRAQSEEARALWQRIAVRLQSGAVHSALLAVLVGVGFFSTTPSAHATAADPAKPARLYIMLSFLLRFFERSSRARLGNASGFCHVQSPFAAAPALRLA